MSNSATTWPLPCSPRSSEMSVIRSIISIGGAGSWALPGRIVHHEQARSASLSKLDGYDAIACGPPFAPSPSLAFGAKTGKSWGREERMTALQRFITASGMTNLADGIAVVAWVDRSSFWTRDVLLVALVPVVEVAAAFLRLLCAIGYDGPAGPAQADRGDGRCVAWRSLYGAGYLGGTSPEAVPFRRLPRVTRSAFRFFSVRPPFYCRRPYVWCCSSGEVERANAVAVERTNALVGPALGHSRSTVLLLVSY